MSRFNHRTSLLFILTLALSALFVATALPAIHPLNSSYAAPPAASFKPAASPLSASRLTAWGDLVIGPTASASAIAADGFYLYAIGGEFVLNTISSAVQRYDPTTNSWSARANLPVGIAETAACYMHGRVYLPGGLNASTWENHMRIYDVSANTWTTATATLPGFSNASVVCDPTSELVYAIGGLDQPGAASAKVRIYDALTSTWRVGASLPAARSSSAAALLPGGKIIVAGGTVAGAISSDVQIYDIGANSWSPATALNIARSGAAASLGPDDKFYVAGGFSTLNQPLNSVELYDPATNSWAAGDSLLHPVGAVNGAFITNRFYVVSGQGLEKDANCSLRQNNNPICDYNQMLDITLP